MRSLFVAENAVKRVFDGVNTNTNVYKFGADTAKKAGIVHVIESSDELVAAMKAAYSPEGWDRVHSLFFILFLNKLFKNIRIKERAGEVGDIQRG